MTQDSISLSLEPREITGKQVKQLRRDGTIPAVIHDHGKPSIVVQGNALDMLKVYRQAGRHHTVKLKAGDQNYTALIRKADFDPKKNQLRHLVFNAVSAHEKVETEIPVRPRYDEGNDSSPAERAGLLVLAQADTVEIIAPADKLPDVIEYDAEKLVEPGDSITVADLIVPSDVEIKTDSTHAVATVYEPSALQAQNEDAGGAADEAAPAEEAAGGEGEATATEGEAESGEQTEQAKEE